jgi:hypothetical protein
MCVIILIKTNELFKNERICFTIDSSSLHLIDIFFNFALSLSNSAHNSLFFLDNSTTFVAIASPPTVFAPNKKKFIQLKIQRLQQTLTLPVNA